MKYTYTGKSILRMFIPSMIVSAAIIALYIAVFRPMGNLLADVIFFVVVYISLGGFIYFMNRKNWENNILGNHEIKLIDNFFIWSNGKQEIKTNLDLLQKIKINPKKIVIKFKSMRKVTIFKSESFEGYDDFISEIAQIAQEKNIKILQK